MKKTLLIITGVLCGLLGLAQGTQMGSSPIYYSSGTVNIGGNSNVSLFTRHIKGKEPSSTNADNLYLNYNTGKPVYVGFGTGMSNLYVSGNLGIGTATPDQALVVNGKLGFDYGNNTSANGIWRNGIKTEYYNNITGVASNVIHEFTGSQGVTVMSMTQGGKVGIGTSSPSAQLHILGDHVKVENESSGRGVLLNSNGEISQMATNAAWLHLQRYHDGPVVVGNNSASNFLVPAGKVGIGTTSPNAKLEVKGDFIRLQETVQGRTLDIYPSVSGATHRFTSGTTTAGYSFENNTDELLRITSLGKVGIGTTSPSEKLEVNGTIRSKKVRVEATGWPDYVFESEYQLSPLNQLEEFVKTNKHLPGVPSAQEVEAKGQDLGDIQATLLKKVEELTLYVIEQDKKQLNLEERMKKLEAENAKLKALLKKE